MGAELRGFNRLTHNHCGSLWLRYTQAWQHIVLSVTMLMQILGHLVIVHDRYMIRAIASCLLNDMQAP